MKRVFFPILLLLILLAGCSDRPKLSDPVKFYYPKNLVTYGETDGMICHQFGEGESEDITMILNTYLTGPEDLSFINPFPAGMRLITIDTQERTATVTVSNDLSTLTGIDATLACVCLAKTTMELADVDIVVIGCESALIDGEQFLRFSKENILWLDESIGTPTDPTVETTTN